MGLVGLNKAGQHIDESGPLRRRQRRQDAVLHGEGCGAKRLPQALTLIREAKHASAPIRGIDAPVNETCRFQPLQDVMNGDGIDAEVRCEAALVEVRSVIQAREDRELDRGQACLLGDLRRQPETYLLKSPGQVRRDAMRVRNRARLEFRRVFNDCRTLLGGKG